MTQLTIDTSVNRANVLMSIPTLPNFDKKIFTRKNLVTYTTAPKTWYRKSAIRLSSVDWDMNMNELEFE